MREDNNDKRELLKYKQGLISKEECEEIEINKPPIYEKPTGFAAVQNFFYHYKLHLSFAAFFVVVGVILAYFTLTRDNPDIKILLIGNTQEASAFFFAEQSAIKTAFEQYTPDFNNDGKVYAACFFIDLVTEGRRPDYVQGNHTKLFGEVLGGTAKIFIGNREALENIPKSADVEFEDFYEDYFPFKGSLLEKSVEFHRMDVPDDLLVVLRKDADENSLTVWAVIRESTTE
jgi:hypothetical protein